MIRHKHVHVPCKLQIIFKVVTPRQHNRDQIDYPSMQAQQIPTSAEWHNIIIRAFNAKDINYKQRLVMKAPLQNPYKIRTKYICMLILNLSNPIGFVRQFSNVHARQFLLLRVFISGSFIYLNEVFIYRNSASAHR